MRLAFFFVMWASLTGVEAGAADARRTRLVESLLRFPLDVSASVSQEVEFTDGLARKLVSTVRFRRDGETIYAVEAIDLEGGKTSRTDHLYRNGELVRFNSQMSGATRDHLMAVFVSPKVSNKIGQIAAGDVFSVPPKSFPVVGCIDGFFVDDYFPDLPGVTVTETGDHARLECQTKYGKSEAWVDSDRECLPVRIRIEKGPEHFTTGMRRIGEILFDPKDPRSALTAIHLEVRDIKIERDGRGHHYITSCALVREKTSSRGRESKEVTRWTVNSITFDPQFEGGSIYPDVPISHGEQVSTEAASQLPYYWSKDERWVVPAAIGLTADSSRPERTRVVLLSILVLVLGLAVLYKHFIRSKAIG